MFHGGRLIDRYFKLSENRTSLKQEMLGGVTTFVTMAYIIIVNPQILAQAGMPADGVVFATCISAAVASLVMGLYANYPIALAPGMSLNAYFTYSVCIAMHVPWRTALAVVFCSGVLFLVLTVTRVREQIVNGIPDCLKHSTAAGIGMFIAFVGLRNAKLVVANTATYVGLGNFADKEVQIACLGLCLTMVLMSRKFPAAAGRRAGHPGGVPPWPAAHPAAQVRRARRGATGLPVGGAVHAVPARPGQAHGRGRAHVVQDPLRRAARGQALPDTGRPGRRLQRRRPRPGVRRRGLGRLARGNRVRR